MRRNKGCGCSTIIAVLFLVLALSSFLSPQYNPSGTGTPAVRTPFSTPAQTTPAQTTPTQNTPSSVTPTADNSGTPASTPEVTPEPLQKTGNFIVDTNHKGVYYQQLTEAGKRIYDTMLDALKNGKDSCTVEYNGDHQPYVDQLKPAIWAIEYDHPELFWLWGGYKASYRTNTFTGAGKLSITTNFYEFWSYSMNKQKYVNNLQRALDDLCAQANAYATDYEKIKFVHDYLVLNVEYDHDAANEILSGKKMSAHSEQSCTAYGALVNGAAVCSGYAHAFQLVMLNLGIECDSVTGNAGEAHQWNALVLEGERYMLDATWDDPSNKRPGQVKYNYFLITTKELNKTHTLDTVLTYPECTGTKY